MKNTKKIQEYCFENGYSWGYNGCVMEKEGPDYKIRCEFWSDRNISVADISAKKYIESEGSHVKSAMSFENESDALVYLILMEKEYGIPIEHEKKEVIMFCVTAYE